MGSIRRTEVTKKVIIEPTPQTPRERRHKVAHPASLYLFLLILPGFGRLKANGTP